MGSKIFGVDVSHWNTYKEVTTSHYESLHDKDFVIAKATQGTDFKDNKFADFMRICEKHNILRGAYHFVTESDPYKQAINFVSTIRPYGDTLIALDFETSGGYMVVSQNTVDKYLLPLAKYVKEMTGVPPLIYASQSVFNCYDLSELRKLDCGAWVAKWDNITDPVKVNNWNNVAIKQYSSVGSIDELKGNTDLNVAFMTESAWRKYANPNLYK